MAFTTIDKSSDYFNTKLYTGNDTASTTISGVGFQSDFTWIKSRTTTENHHAFDAVRGGGYRIYPNLTAAQSYIATTLTSWTSDGFVVGTDDGVNANGANFVSWNWKANGAGSSNTDGSITSTVSANTTSGFSIVKYTGTGNGGVNTVGHGLGVIPKVIIIKALTTTQGWYQYHEILGNTKVIDFTSAGAVTNDYWSDTTPTASVFNVIGNNVVAGSFDYVAYCFAEVPGFSKFGSYTGNGNVDGTFVYTGFKPAFINIKQHDTARDWMLFDNKRNGYNYDNRALNPGLVDTEGATQYLDIYSNGFKLKVVDSLVNIASGNYLYQAFAEAPLVGTNNVPANAR
jgi:hypothetical protein